MNLIVFVFNNIWKMLRIFINLFWGSKKLKFLRFIVLAWQNWISWNIKMKWVASLMKRLIMSIRWFCCTYIFKTERLNSSLKYIIPAYALFLNGYMTWFHHLNCQVIICNLVIILILFVTTVYWKAFQDFSQRQKF